jgi:uncharacterized RDD family membrane protein YckC
MVLHEVITAEKVPFTYRVAGIGSRFLAWLVDFWFIVLLGLAGSMFTMPLEARQEGLGGAVTQVWSFLLLWGYFLVFEWLWIGQTPGKRLLGIRVIQEKGTSISFFQSAVRNVVRWADSLPLFYGLGFSVMAANAKQRRLGDWAAGTLVVHVERKAKPIQALHEGGDVGVPNDSMVRQRLGQLTREQKQTLLDLCLRRDQLRISDRAQLFRAVADYFRQQLELVPQQHQSDEKFVVGLAVLLGSGSKE